MAFIDTSFECSGKTKKNIRVPGRQGDSDRTIYVNGSDSGYRLGHTDDKVYNKRSGNLTANNLQDFAKNYLGCTDFENQQLLVFLFTKTSFSL